MLAIKDKRVLVEFENPEMLKKGDLVQTSPEASQALDGGRAVQSRRDYGLELNFSYLSATEKSQNSSKDVNRMDWQSLLGFNLGNFEVGPLFSITSSSSSGGLTTTVMGFGAFADYNYWANQSPGQHVLSARIIGKFLSGKTGGFDRSGSAILIGPVYKGFFFGPSTALTLGLLYMYQSYGAEGSPAIETTGIQVTSGLLTYF